MLYHLNIEITHEEVNTLDGEAILSVKSINKSYPGTKALTDVHLDLRQGEVHALMGENGAGKSTLMNIIGGVIKPDSGQIILNGKEVKFHSPKDAQDAGIGFVHQEIALCTHMTVAENIYMGRIKGNILSILDFAQLNKKAGEILSLFKTSITPQTIVRKLTVADQQVVEIVKAISLDCKILVLDEPTSSLTESETEALFVTIAKLKARGISILYISHKMSEIFRICDSITILRDGHFIDSLKVKDISPEIVISKMVGRNITNLYPPKSTRVTEKIIEVKNLTRKGVFNDISFNIYKGEILGIAGLVGAKRTEVARAVCGIDQVDSGEVYFEGEKVHFKGYSDAIKKGIAYLTEDRKIEGLFLNLSIKKNITASCLEKISKFKLIDPGAEKNWANSFSEKLRIKLYNINQKANSLSGGNQQKIVIAKWLSINPKLIFMDEPTRGIDVGAKSEIHDMLRKLSNEGIGIVIISSELPEIIGMCDRVIVMSEGRITGSLDAGDLSEEHIMTYAASSPEHGCAG